jgi:manganese efflux pump family protein
VVAVVGAVVVVVAVDVDDDAENGIPWSNVFIARQEIIRMSIGALLLLALSVSMDNFAVAMAIGATGDVLSLRQMLKFPTMSGIIQFFMPLLGWFGGSRVAFLFRGYENWLMFGILVFIAGCMFRSALSPEDVKFRNLFSNGKVFSVAFALSFDSLAIGLALAMTRVNILQVSAVIATVTACLSFAGMLIGDHLGQAMGRRSRFAGGLVLLMLGFRAIIQC